MTLSDRITKLYEDELARREAAEQEIAVLRVKLDRAVRDADRAIEIARSVDAKEREALRADAERLDWLARRCSVNFLFKHDDGTIEHVVGPTDLRAAIAAAMTSSANSD